MSRGNGKPQNIDCTDQSVQAYAFRLLYLYNIKAVFHDMSIIPERMMQRKTETTIDKLMTATKRK